MSNVKPIEKIIKCEPCNGTGEVECPAGCLESFRSFAKGHMCGKHLQDELCHTCLHGEETETTGMIHCFECEGEGVEVNELWEEAQELHKKMTRLFEMGATLRPSGIAHETEAFMHFIGA